MTHLADYGGFPPQSTRNFLGLSLFGTGLCLEDRKDILWLAMSDILKSRRQLSGERVPDFRTRNGDWSHLLGTSWRGHVATGLGPIHL